MADELKMARAKKVYETVCAALDHRGWSYGKEEQELLVHFTVSGDDIPMQMMIFVQEEQELVTVLSPLPFKMSENKRIEGAIATCVASYGMMDGSFDFDMAKGSIAFRLVSSYRDSVLGEGVIQYMISCACAMADQYNDRFLALDKGMISIQEFIKME